MGDWAWGLGDWGLGPIPIPNPQSPNKNLKSSLNKFNNN